MGVKSSIKRKSQRKNDKMKSISDALQPNELSIDQNCKHKMEVIKA